MLGAIAVKAAKGWRALNDPKGFDAQWGPRTAERRHPCYNYTRYNHVKKTTPRQLERTVVAIRN